ncbi:hypothetical protein [Pseudomonas sp. SDI]|uniref:hypothetical protein n=1 Tax=Pseudomonas sp. SDI TaxID=2170734 RepID=UPI001057A5C4|nr:hypothetical protein [Pseudomonas sp. SDI]
MKAQDVCASSDAETCRKVKYTEAGGFIAGLVGGAFTGAALSYGTSDAICLALGIPSAGAFACGLVVGVGSLASGALGELSGELIYEATQ